MVQRSSSYIEVAKRRFRCMVKVAVPCPYGFGLGLTDLEIELIRLFGRDDYKIAPSDWEGALQAVAILFDDADTRPKLRAGSMRNGRAAASMCRRDPASNFPAPNTLTNPNVSISMGS